MEDKILSKDKTKQEVNTTEIKETVEVTDNTEVKDSTEATETKDKVDTTESADTTEQSKDSKEDSKKEAKEDTKEEAKPTKKESKKEAKLAKKAAKAESNNDDDFYDIQKKKKAKKRRTVLIVILIIAIVLGARIYKGYKDGKNASLYDTAQITVESIVNSIGYSGTIVGAENQDLTCTAQFSATQQLIISDINVKEGDMVKKGDVLVVLDSKPIADKLAEVKKSYSNTVGAQSITNKRDRISYDDTFRTSDTAVMNAAISVENAEMSLSSAYKSYNDFIKSHNDGVITDKDFQDGLMAKVHAVEQAQNSLDSARRAYDDAIANANSNMAKAELTIEGEKYAQNYLPTQHSIEDYEKMIEDCTITAPFDGIISAKNFNAGDKYTGGAILVISDVSQHKVELKISEYDIVDVQIGQKAVVSVPAIGEDKFDGTVDYISATAKDGFYTVRIMFDSPQGKIRLGMTGNIAVIIDSIDNALCVPYNAINDTDFGTKYIQVEEEDGTIRDITVDVLFESNYYTAISSRDIKEGMTVVLHEVEDESADDQMVFMF